MRRVQQNHLLVKFQGGANSSIISYRLCSGKEMWHSMFVSPYIYASNHKPEINDTFLLTFRFDPSFLQYILFCFSHATINPLKPELNHICYLLALLGAHHFLHVSRIRVKSLTPRLLMSHIYGAPILDVSRSHTTTQHSR